MICHLVLELSALWFKGSFAKLVESRKITDNLTFKFSTFHKAINIKTWIFNEHVGEYFFKHFENLDSLEKNRSGESGKQCCLMNFLLKRIVKRIVNNSRKSEGWSLLICINIQRDDRYCIKEYCSAANLCYSWFLLLYEGICCKFELIWQVSEHSLILRCRWASCS